MAGSVTCSDRLFEHEEGYLVQYADSLRFGSEVDWSYMNEHCPHNNINCPCLQWHQCWIRECTGWIFGDVWYPESRNTHSGDVDKMKLSRIIYNLIGATPLRMYHITPVVVIPKSTKLQPTEFQFTYQINGHAYKVELMVGKICLDDIHPELDAYSVKGFVTAL